MKGMVRYDGLGYCIAVVFEATDVGFCAFSRSTHGVLRPDQGSPVLARLSFNLPRQLAAPESHVPPVQGKCEGKGRKQEGFRTRLQWLRPGETLAVWGWRAMVELSVAYRLTCVGARDKPGGFYSARPSSIKTDSFLGGGRDVVAHSMRGMLYMALQLLRGPLLQCCTVLQILTIWIFKHLT